jgi:hypothetical protein
VVELQLQVERQKGPHLLIGRDKRSKVSEAAYISEASEAII